LICLTWYVCTLVVYITYNMGNRDSPDLYAHALGPVARGLGHIPVYQANFSSYPCYSLYIYAVFNFDLATHWGKNQ